MYCKSRRDKKLIKFQSIYMFLVFTAKPPARTKNQMKSFLFGNYFLQIKTANNTTEQIP